MIKFTVDRNKWLRSEGSRASKLLRPFDGKMCCLGFLCLSVGVPKEKLMNVPSPYSLVLDFPEVKELIPSFLLEDYESSLGKGFVNTSACNELMVENDTEADEKVLTQMFRKNGVQVEFIN